MSATHSVSSASWQFWADFMASLPPTERPINTGLTTLWYVIQRLRPPTMASQIMISLWNELIMGSMVDQIRRMVQG